MRNLATFDREGFVAKLIERDDKSCYIVADADIDADGANGQNGEKAAYMTHDRGSELLANGGMRWNAALGRVEPNASWYKDIVILDEGKLSIREFTGGVIASKTSYRYPGKAVDDPAAYVDSATVPYVCAPPELVQGVAGVVKGCRVHVYNQKTKKDAWAVVADVGPRHKVGEISIYLAELLGINADPRTGGEEKDIIEYTFFPDVAATVKLKTGEDYIFRLMKANGTYV